jgi:hypothetical protein
MPDLISYSHVLNSKPDAHHEPGTRTEEHRINPGTCRRARTRAKRAYHENSAPARRVAFFANRVAEVSAEQRCAKPTENSADDRAVFQRVARPLNLADRHSWRGNDDAALEKACGRRRMQHARLTGGFRGDQNHPQQSEDKERPRHAAVRCNLLACLARFNCLG